MEENILSNNDKQRIEQECRKYILELHFDSGQSEGFKAGAEYATKYERNWVMHLQERVRVLAAKCDELESERSELIGKLQARLERCRKVSGYSSGFSDIHNEIDFLDLLLNSLKTK